MRSNRAQIPREIAGQCPARILNRLLSCAIAIGVLCCAAGARENVAGTDKWNQVASSANGLVQPSLPFTLEMDGFTLYVQTWQSGIWDPQHRRIVSASGLARLYFDCQPRIVLPFPGKTLVERTFTIVQMVRNPAQEISLGDAKKLNAQVTLGASITLRIPSDVHTDDEITQAVGELLYWPIHPIGGMEVQFDHLTIDLAPSGVTGKVVAGTATYPVANANPAPAALTIQGFVVELSSLTITPQGATANGILQMPASIVDPGTGHPGQIPLGSFTVTRQCVFRSNLPNLAYGPWAVGNTEMEIQGVGVVADFDPTWASPSAQAGSAAATPSWEGVLLGGGNTVSTASGTVISNSGYVRAAYSYPSAQVDAQGLTAKFTMTAPFSFQTLQPFGYTVQMATGFLDLSNSGISLGQFSGNKITAPTQAATNGSAAPLLAGAPTLALQANLDLDGRAVIPTPIAWGDYARNPATGAFFQAQNFLQSSFYISGTNSSNFFPLDSQDNFAEPSALCQDPQSAGLQGLTACFPDLLQVKTSDTPQSVPLQFIAVDRDNRETEGWLNIAFDGVHGRLLNLVTQTGSSTDLGPVGQPFYLGHTAFKAAPTNPSIKVAQYSLSIYFVTSSVENAAMTGAVALPTPVGSNLSFSQMGFTSTAQISAANIPLNTPLPLSYWGVSLVKQTGAVSAAVMNVHTGEVFFTAAGIAEKRHFHLPFYLTWGEMLADGELGRLIFDYNSAGQQFDGFYYTPSFVKLSDYVPNSPAYLKTAGTLSFDFFGAKYVNLNDTYVPSQSAVPYNSRSVTLAFDSDPQGPYHATDNSLQANWSNGLGTFNFTYGYDVNAQDGFIGTGTVGLLGISGVLPGSVVLKADPMICISVNDTAHHSISLGPLASFATMGRISGCGCINNGQLERIMLTGELENDANANVFLSSASYGSIQWMMTPSLSQLEFQGDMFLTVLTGGNLEITGDAQFTVDLAQAYVDGNVQGHFDTSTLMGFQSVTADGQLDWHVSAPANSSSYQELQGNLSVTIVMPVGSSAVEGGFYVGVNAPTSEAWILNAAGSKFQLNTAALPPQLTGVYGYGKFSESVNLWVVSGGVEAFAGLGGFVLPANFPLGGLNAVLPGAGIGLPYVIGNTGVHVWGEILGGLVSADGWADLNVITPYPFSYQGTLGLQACAAWVVCGTADVTAGINSTQGLYVQ